VGLLHPFRIGTRVYLTLPDGRRVGFTFAPIQHQQIGVTYYTPAFVADPGVDYTLRSADALLTLANNQFFDLGTTRAYNPASGLFAGPECTLTAPDGTIFYLSSAHGVEKQVLPNGTRLIYSDGGILTSDGESIRFIRDAAGRLTDMIASDGHEVLYNYDATGHLTKVDRLFSGEVTHYAYAADDAHRLSLVVAPDAQPSAVIRYAPNPLVEPITANLGGAFQFSSSTPTGSLAAGNVDRYAFVLRDSELQSTKSKRLLIGASVQDSGGFQPGVPTIAGHAPVTSRLTNDSAFALFALDRAGFQVLELAGRDALASGGYTLCLFVAGELSGDGLVDGQDSEQLVSALGSTAGDADLDQSGTVDAADVQILAGNFGFVANRPPLVTNGSAKTHQDLGVRVALAGLASDPDGDPVYFHIVGAQHGTARLSGDGLSVLFTPDLGFTGQAGFQFVATDCFGTSDAASVTVQISAAPLVALDFAERNPKLQAGESRQLVVIGDFADETGVILPGSYVAFSSTNPTSVVVSATGQIAALHEGFGAIVISSHGQQAATAFRVGTPTSPGDILLAGVGPHVFPAALSLADHGGTRQLQVNFLGGPQIASAADGTQYYVSDPNVISVRPDGLITAGNEGTAVVTIVHRGSEVRVPVKVHAPSIGPTMIGREGGVVQGQGGLRVMVAPGALNRDVQVSIKPLALSDLPIPPPPADKGFFFGAAFTSIRRAQS
jgi:YD repeat-containing protein